MMMMIRDDDNINNKKIILPHFLLTELFEIVAAAAAATVNTLAATFSAPQCGLIYRNFIMLIFNTSYMFVKEYIGK